MATTKKQGSAKQPAKKTEQKAPEGNIEKVVTPADVAANPEGELKAGETVGIPTEAKLTDEEKAYAEAYDSYHKTFGNFPSPNLETKQILEAIEDHVKAQLKAAGEGSGAAAEAEEEEEAAEQAAAPEAGKKLDGVLEPADDEIVVTDGTSPRIMKKATWDLAKNSAGKRWSEVPNLPKELKSK